MISEIIDCDRKTAENLAEIEKSIFGTAWDSDVIKEKIDSRKFKYCRGVRLYFLKEGTKYKRKYVLDHRFEESHWIINLIRRQHYRYSLGSYVDCVLHSR